MTLNQFAKENSFEHKMNNSRGLDSWSNYGGDSLGDLVIIPLVSRNRDSEILDESNFEAALEILGGESKTVQIHRFGHWGCGWFEVITVNPKDKQSLKLAQKIETLLSEYPVLDEEDYRQRENEYHEEYAEGSKQDLSKALSIHFSVSQSKELIRFAFILQLECQRYYGNDSCIDIYSMREPDERDLKRFSEVLEQLTYSFDGDSFMEDLIEYFQACISGVTEN